MMSAIFFLRQKYVFLVHFFRKKAEKSGHYCQITMKVVVLLLFKSNPDSRMQKNFNLFRWEVPSKLSWPQNLLDI